MSILFLSQAATISVVVPSSLVKLGFAPCDNSKLAIALSVGAGAYLRANIKGVHPFSLLLQSHLGFALGSAPAFSKVCTIATDPLMEVACRDVQSFTSFALMSAPCCSKACRASLYLASSAV